ncbi:MAG TPA: hypothetical protein VFV34_06105, partial [Blastocatellia bacterium]|nr:hypothetical protein [Blastocatellia bacterium]
IEKVGGHITNEPGPRHRPAQPVFSFEPSQKLYEFKVKGREQVTGICGSQRLHGGFGFRVTS